MGKTRLLSSSLLLTVRETTQVCKFRRDGKLSGSNCRRLCCRIDNSYYTSLFVFLKLHASLVMTAFLEAFVTVLKEMT